MLSIGAEIMPTVGTPLRMKAMEIQNMGNRWV